MVIDILTKHLVLLGRPGLIENTIFSESASGPAQVILRPKFIQLKIYS